MLKMIVTTHIVYYLMAVVAVIGVVAKLVSHITLKSLVRAASNMSKSTHKLIKLIRSKYDHASVVHDSVENVDAFVEKYIYEYKSLGLKIHTWRQLELQSVVFAGVFAAIGGAAQYLMYEFGDGTYRYIGLGLAEMVMLFVLMHLSDEDYKIEVMKAYIVDYLDNVCAPRYRKMHQVDEEPLRIIGREESTGNSMEKRQTIPGDVKTAESLQKEFDLKKEDTAKRDPVITMEEKLRQMEREKEKREQNMEAHATQEPSKEEPNMREDTIRQILEEFLA